MLQLSQCLRSAFCGSAVLAAGRQLSIGTCSSDLGLDLWMDDVSTMRQVIGHRDTATALWFIPWTERTLGSFPVELTPKLSLKW
jgi:hypothetical protein